jgi:hypothetical protein
MNFFKRLIVCLAFFSLSLSVNAQEFNSNFGEIAFGGFLFDPSGTHVYSDVLQGSSLDLENDLNISDDQSFFGRLKINNNGHIPGVYASALYISSEGENLNSFIYGGKQINNNSDFTSSIELLNYDLTVFYSLKGFERASLGRLSMELGLSGRWIEADTEVSQANNVSVSASEKDYAIGFFACFAGKPTDNIELYAQWKGLCFTDIEFTNLTAGAKLNLFGPFFAGGGYMIEKTDMDQNGFVLDIESEGVFIEAGMRF